MPDYMQAPIAEELTLRDIFFKANLWYMFLISKKYIIISFCLLGALLGILFSYVSKPVYTASTTFVLDEGTGGGMSQYAGLASMVGVDLGGGSNNSIFSGENITELYKSRLMIEKALLSVSASHKGLLIDDYIAFNNLRKSAFKNVSDRDLNFNLKKSGDFNRKQDSVINYIVNDIRLNYLTVSKPDKKLSIILVEIKAKNEEFAKNFTDKLVYTVNQFYIDTKTKKAADNLHVLQKQTDSVRADLNKAITGVAVSTDLNPNANPSRQILKVPSQKRQIDAEANKLILTELEKNLELSKMSLRKETPLIQVIDIPVYPLLKTKVSFLRGAVIGAFSVGFLTILFITMRMIFKKIIE